VIDVIKIVHRKYERERVVEDLWILGMIHRRHACNNRLKIYLDNKRDKDTLIKLIKKHVVEGTEIHTNCWRGYIDLEEHSYLVL